MKILCPLSAYGACSETVEIVQFGDHTKSAKRGKPKSYIRCPDHGSIRMDKDSAQIIITGLSGGSMPAPVSNPEPEPEPNPEGDSHQQTEIKDEWGF